MTKKFIKPKPASEPKPAFGFFDESMIPKLQRLLAPFGLRLVVRKDRHNWGDQVEVRIQPSSEHIDWAWIYEWFTGKDSRDVRVSKTRKKK